NYGVDGIMIGRAAIGHPWIFREVKHFMATGEHLAPPTVAERVEVCRNHLLSGIQWKGERTGIVEMRRHYTNYFKGMDHFKPFRLKLVSCDSLSEILETLDAIQEHFVLEAAGV
ncbi:MAG: tRNA dihydrouridine synthase DusB, partial [Bacteroidota bacterium]